MRHNKIVPEPQGNKSQKNNRTSLNFKKKQPQNIAQESGIHLRKNQQLEENKQSNNANKIELNDQVLYACRICLEQGPVLHANNQDQLQNMNQKLQSQLYVKQPKYLMAACRCQGTAGYVHQKCMIQWVDTLCKRTKQKQVKCEICLNQILYQRKTIAHFQCKCKNLQQISSCNLACFIILMFVVAGSVALLIKANTLNLNKIAQVVIYAFIATMSIALFASCMLLIKEGFYKKRKETIKIYSNDQIDILGIDKGQLSHYEIRSHTNARSHTIARSIRSNRSIASRLDQIERRNESRHQQRQRSRRERSRRDIQSRQNIGEGQSQQRIGGPRSAQHIRSIREPTSRSIQIRSRNNIQQ